MWSVGKLQEIKTQKLQWHKEKLMRNEQFGSKKSRFIKGQEVIPKVLTLGIRTSLSQVLLVGTILISRYAMNEIINKFSLAGDKFMPEMQKCLDLHIVLVNHFLKTKKKITKI